jgi:hypothetical protein
MQLTDVPLNFLSRRFSVPSSEGREIVGFVDRTPDAAPESPVVIVCPAFTKTSRDGVVLAWYLMRHGFQVVRYDNTCHVGESEGDIFDFTLRSAVADFGAIADFASEQFPSCALGVVAPSLSFRVALRALRGRSEFLLLFGLVGTVCVQATINAVIGEDEDWNRPRLPAYRIEGHTVSSRFAHCAIEDDMCTLESTIRDMRSCRLPILNIAGEDDHWVRLDDVRRAFAEDDSQEPRRLSFLPGVSHKLARNPVATALALGEMTAACSDLVAGRILPAAKVIHPTIGEVARVRQLTAARRTEAQRIADAHA